MSVSVAAHDHVVVGVARVGRTCGQVIVKVVVGEHGVAFFLIGRRRRCLTKGIDRGRWIEEVRGRIEIEVCVRVPIPSGR